MRVLFHPEFPKDIRRFEAEYARISDGLAERFRQEIDAAVDAIESSPGSAAGLDFPSLAKCFPKRDVRFAKGKAPAVTRSQAGHVAATPRAVRPGVLGAHRGTLFHGDCGTHTP